METYFTHDNGGRPFKVQLDDSTSTAHVYQLIIQDTDDNEYAPNPVYTARYIKKFIGMSPLCRTTQFSGGFGKNFDGNSILLCLGNRDEEQNMSYVYIGECIKLFRSMEIVDYISPVGNNDVPYPYAITVDGKYHLLIEDVTIVYQPGEEDPYDYYYRTRIITYPEEDANKMHWFIDDEEYTMCYRTDPSCNYSWWIPKEAKEMSIVLNGERKVIGRDAYCAIIAEHGNKMQFEKIKSITTIVNRQW